MKLLGLSLVVATLSPVLLHAQADWTGVGSDPGGMKYSTLTQITPANVSKLTQAWTYDTGDPAGGFRGWEITPIVVSNVMYFPTTGKKILALNAQTGQEIWKVDLTTCEVVGGWCDASEDLSRRSL